MAHAELGPAQALDILGSTVPQIARVTAGVQPALLCLAPAPGEWSANEVLAHLRSCADVWGGAISRLLAEDNPTLRAINPRSFIESTDYRELAFARSLRAYAAQRAQLLAGLRSLPPTGWARRALVTGGGRPLERTALSFAQRLARHERPHTKQIGRIVRAVSP